MLRSKPEAHPGASELETLVNGLAPTFGWVRKTALEDAHAAVQGLMQRPPRWLWSGLREREQEPDTKTYWFVFPRSWTIMQIRDELERYGIDCDAHRCQHDFDCCGCWGSRGLHVSRETWYARSMREQGRVPHVPHFQIAIIAWGRNV